MWPFFAPPTAKALVSSKCTRGEYDKKRPLQVLISSINASFDKKLRKLTSWWLAEEACRKARMYKINN